MPTDTDVIITSSNSIHTDGGEDAFAHNGDGSFTITKSKAPMSIRLHEGPDIPVEPGKPWKIELSDSTTAPHTRHMTVSGHGNSPVVHFHSVTEGLGYHGEQRKLHHPGKYTHTRVGDIEGGPGCTILFRSPES